MNRDQFESEVDEEIGSGVKYNKKNPLLYPCILRNIQREDKLINSDEDAFNHLCCLASTRPIVKKITAGRIVVDKIAVPGTPTPEIFITQDSINFLNLYNRYKRYGMEVLYDFQDIPSCVLEAFDVINNTIDEEQNKVYKTQKAEIEKSKKESNKNKPIRKSLPK